MSKRILIDCGPAVAAITQHPNKNISVTILSPATIDDSGYAPAESINLYLTEEVAAQFAAALKPHA